MGCLKPAAAAQDASRGSQLSSFLVCGPKLVRNSPRESAMNIYIYIYHMFIIVPTALRGKFRTKTCPCIWRNSSLRPYDILPDIRDLSINLFSKMILVNVGHYRKLESQNDLGGLPLILWEFRLFSHKMSIVKVLQGTF